MFIHEDHEYCYRKQMKKLSFSIQKVILQYTKSYPSAYKKLSFSIQKVILQHTESYPSVYKKAPSKNCKMFCGVLQTPYHKLKMLLQSYEFEFN